MPGSHEIKTQIPDLLGAHPRHIQAVTDPNDASPPMRKPIFGKVVALAVAALFGMVALGVVWVWQRAHVEQSWRDRVNATEPFQAPRSP